AASTRLRWCRERGHPRRACAAPRSGPATSSAASTDRLHPQAPDRVGRPGATTTRRQWMRRTLIALAALALGATALAETRSVTVNVDARTGRPVPVSFDLLTLRDAIGAEFPMDWTSLKVSVGGEEVPYQIDDVDLNGRLSAGDQLGFLATGPATIEIADAPGEGASYEPALTVEGEDPAVITSSLAEGFVVEVPAHGLARIAGYGDAQALMANEVGILRFSGYPESTWWANEQYGPHEEYTNLEAGGMRHVG